MPRITVQQSTGQIQEIYTRTVVEIIWPFLYKVEEYKGGSLRWFSKLVLLRLVCYISSHKCFSQRFVFVGVFFSEGDTVT